MTRLRCWNFALAILGSLILGSSPAFGQDNGGYRLFRPNQEVRVRPLPSLVARSDDLPDVLLTSLDTILHDRTICCGKDSALEDRAVTANPLSLKDIASKLQGRWLLSDGRPILVTPDFPPSSPTIDLSYWIIGHLMHKHAMLMVWGAHLYVVYGAVFDEVVYSDGTPNASSIHKLLLLDTRYADSRREVTFNRDTDDWSKVEGMLSLDWKLQ